MTTAPPLPPFPRPSLSAAARTALGRLAREAVRAALEHKPYQPTPPDDPATRTTGGGCFVTLKTGGRLRGCLGCFESPAPLWRTVAEYARASLLEDPRFAGQRVTPAEWPGLAMEVSVLSPLAPCPDPSGIALGAHGIQVRGRRDGRRGCFLPQVATETGWDVATFWSRCCADKAGLSPDAWRNGAAECFIFTAEVFEA